MTTQEAKTIVQSMVRHGMIEGDIEAALAAYAPDFRYHNPVLRSMPPMSGLDAMRTLLSGARLAFPDMRYRIDALIGDGDMVAVLYSWTGSHQASLGGLPATGRRVETTGAIVCRVSGERIVEQWDIDDRLDVMDQLGLLSKPDIART